MRLVKGLSQVDAGAIRAAVEHHGSFRSIDALHRASGVRVKVLRRLAAADAFGSMGLDRQTALWHVRALRDEKLPMFDQNRAGTEGRRDKGHLHSERSVPQLLSPLLPQPVLPPVSGLRKVAHDYAALGLSLRAHPVQFIRDTLTALGATPNIELKDEQRWRLGRQIAVAGLVLVRQRPSTAGGVIFMTIEDETGIANLIVRPNIYKKYRRAARHGVVVLAKGRVERQGEVVHVLVRQIDEVTLQSDQLEPLSRDFH
jgi:error-prone DNA polymerase